MKAINFVTEKKNRRLLPYLTPLDSVNRLHGYSLYVPDSNERCDQYWMTGYGLVLQDKHLLNQMQSLHKQLVDMMTSRGHSITMSNPSYPSNTNLWIPEGNDSQKYSIDDEVSSKLNSFSSKNDTGDIWSMSFVSTTSGDQYVPTQLLVRY